MCKTANVWMSKSSRHGSELKRSLQIVQGTECKNANVWMCKSSRHGSKLKRGLQIVQKCKSVDVQIESTWIRAQKKTANCANCATQHRSRGFNSLLANFLGSASKRKSSFEVGSLVGWRVSELHEGVSCRPDVLKCFGLLVKQRRSQCYAPTTAQTIILAMLH